MNGYNEINCILHVAEEKFIETESAAVMPGPSSELLRTVRSPNYDTMSLVRDRPHIVHVSKNSQT